MTAALDAPERLATIARLDLDAPELREKLDALVSRAAESLGFPISLVSIVLGDAQWFVAKHGLQGWLNDVAGTPVEWSFCAHVAKSGEALNVPDARMDSRFQENPLVEFEGVRCYHGVPLTTADGTCLGSLCVIGADARPLDAAADAKLREFADDVITLVEGRDTSRS